MNPSGCVSTTSPRPRRIFGDPGGLARTRCRPENRLQSAAWLGKGCAVAALDNCSFTFSNPVSPTNHLGEIAKEIPAASLAAARHWGFWTLVGPNFVRARTNSQTVLPLAASEGARQVLALGAKVRPGPGPSASSSRSAISPRRLSASAALADALSRPADQWTAGPGDREFFRSTRV